MGLETEYAFGVLGPHGERLDQAEYITRLMTAARDRLVHLQGFGPNDLYLQTGARLYVDAGMHPEWATPEVSNPWDAVRYLKAANRVLASLIDGLEAGSGVGEVLMGRCNVSYGNDATWGRHESYSFRGSFSRLAHELIPFLASRVIYHGAGGFTRSPGIDFTLSPRAFHILRDMSGDSTNNRAIFHTKHESLNNAGIGRVHILCGDSLCSDLGNFVTVGATALVIAAVEGGLLPRGDLHLRNAVEALHRFARDPTCRTEKAPLADGKAVSALEIQRHYCRRIAGHLNSRFMPEWAGEVHARWEQLLERLEHAPESVAYSLDAPMKLKIFKGHAERRSFDWARVESWNLVVNALRQRMCRTDHAPARLTAGAILDKRGPLAAQVEGMKWFMRRRGLTWDRFDAFQDLRAELQEIDTRWTQLGPRGIFHCIEESCPDLAHAVSGVDRIEDAVLHPPPDTRAAVRGALVKELSHENRKRGGFHCCWEYVLDRKRRRIVNMADDPFVTEVKWQATQKDKEPSAAIDFGAEGEMMRRQIERLREARRQRERRAQQPSPAETQEELSLPF